MANIKSTISTAMEYRKMGKLEEWVHEFLCNEGDNKPFSDGLKLFPRYYLGPIKLSLNAFGRCCGPEKHLKYVISTEHFEKYVSKMIEEINDAWDVPPLIINYVDGKLELNDGNHRYEALKRVGYTEYYVIVWTTEESEMKEFKEKYLQ